MSNTVPNERLLLRGSEVADLIGCSRAMAYRLMQRGVIPVVRVPGGKTVRVPAEALRAWIRANTEAAGGKPLTPIAGILRYGACVASAKRRGAPVITRARRGNRREGGRGTNMPRITPAAPAPPSPAQPEPPPPAPETSSGATGKRARKGGRVGFALKDQTSALDSVMEGLQKFVADTASGDIDSAFIKPALGGDGVFFQAGETEYFLSRYSGRSTKDASCFTVDLDRLDGLPAGKLADLLKAVHKHEAVAGAEDGAPLSAYSLGEYFFDSTAEPVPDQQFYAGLLGRSDLAVWLGREKHRKSNVILQAAITAALGRDFLGFKFMAASPLRVVLIDFESKSNSLKQRYDAILAALELSDKEKQQVKDNLENSGSEKDSQGRTVVPQVPDSIEGRQVQGGGRRSDILARTGDGESVRHLHHRPAANFA